MVSIRRLEAEDRDKFAGLFERLSPESRYRRFLHPVVRPDQVPLDQLLDLDHHDREALAALDGGELVGVARYARRSDGDLADLAVTVADAWQGQGLGTRLLASLFKHATRAGLAGFALSMQADNRPAIALFRRFAPGAPLRLSHGVYEATVPLTGGTQMLDERLIVLRSLPELAPYSTAELRGLLPRFDEVAVVGGSVLARAGRPAAQYVVLLEGELDGDQASIDWQAMWDRGDSCSTVVAARDSRLLVMGRAGFRAVAALGRREVRVVVGDEGSGRRPALHVGDRVA